MDQKSDKMRHRTVRGRDPHSIQDEIRRTRANMRYTIGEIEERLSAPHLKAKAKDTIREATSGNVTRWGVKAREVSDDMKSNLMQYVQDHPISAALAGLGLGWLLAASIKTAEQATGEKGYSEGGWTEFGRRASELGGEWGGQARDYMSEAKMRAREGYEQMGEKMSSFMDESPLMFAAVALAVGAVLGMSIPQSEYEKHFGRTELKVQQFGGEDVGQAAENFNRMTEPLHH